MNSPGDRLLTANKPDSLKREADNSISCWKGFLCAWSSSGVSWSVGKPRPQTAAVSSWAAHGCTYIFHTQESFLMAFITPNWNWVEIVLPNPTSDATTPCERLRDVTTGRDRVACAEEDESKKPLKAAGSDGFRQWDFSSMAAHTPMWSQDKYWSWIAWFLCTWKATKNPTNQYKLFQQTTKQNIHWKEARHWGEDVKCTDLLFFKIIFYSIPAQFSTSNPSIFKRGGKKKVFAFSAKVHMKK